MNEVLLKRLLGACVLVGVTIVLANLLPAPQAVPPPEENTRRVTFDLRQPTEVAKIESAPLPDASAPAPESTEAASTEPEPQPEPRLEVQPEPKSEAKPEPKAEPNPAPKPVVKPRPEPAPSAPKTLAWYLQIGAYAFQANATKSVAKLKAAGLQPHEDTITMTAGKRFRVRCGPFASQEEAEQSKTKAAQIGFADARVARE